MDQLLQNVGQRYLDQKVYSAPQQIETLVKKQFTGGSGAEKSYGTKGSTASQATGGDDESVLPSKSSMAGSRGKDDEITKLRRELAEYKINGAGNKPARGGQREAKARSKSEGINALGGRLENGQVSTKAKSRLPSESKTSKAERGIQGLSAMNGRIEKGKISTKSQRHTHAGGIESAVEKPASREGQSSLSSFRSKPTHGSEHAEGSRRASKATSESNFSSSHRSRANASPTRSVESSATSKAPPHHRNRAHSSPTRSTKSSAPSKAPPSRYRQSSPTRSIKSSAPSHHPDDLDSLVSYQTHGGSAALLHARERRRRKSELGIVPEIPPLEVRPEFVEGGFMPHRAEARKGRDREGEVAIVEVFEDTGRGRGGTPFVREVGRGGAGREREGMGVVEVRDGGAGRKLFRVG